MIGEKYNPLPEKSKGLLTQTQDFSSSPARGEVKGQRFIKANHKNNADDYVLARKLRNDASPVEWKLWVCLRENAKAKKIKFRRQHAVHPYVADFACMAARVLIEIDGDSHAGKEGYDRLRERFLRKQGFDVLRFSNDEVVHNVDGVVTSILLHVERRLKQIGTWRTETCMDPSCSGQDVL